MKWNNKVAAVAAAAIAAVGAAALGLSDDPMAIFANFLMLLGL